MLRRRLSTIFQREMSEMGLGTRRPALIRHPRKQPFHDLPVAANPAMLAPDVSAVVRRIAIHNFNIADKSGTRISAFDKVMAQDGIARKTMIEDAMHGSQIIQSLADECSLAVQILINIRSRVRVDVKPGTPGIDRRQPGLCRTLDANCDARLQNSIALSDNIAPIDDRPA